VEGIIDFCPDILIRITSPSPSAAVSHCAFHWHPGLSAAACLFCRSAELPSGRRGWNRGKYGWRSTSNQGNFDSSLPVRHEKRARIKKKKTELKIKIHFLSLKWFFVSVRACLRTQHRFQIPPTDDMPTNRVLCELQLQLQLKEDAKHFVAKRKSTQLAPSFLVLCRVSLGGGMLIRTHRNS
jgi:hypothetical protein